MDGDDAAAPALGLLGGQVQDAQGDGQFVHIAPATGVLHLSIFMYRIRSGPR